MRLIETGLAGLVIIEPDVHGDNRGFFMEVWHSVRFAEAGLPAHFMQANLSRSGPDVIRGLHYQFPHSQGKLVSVPQGRVFDVAVDIRSDSPTFGQWAGVELSADNHRQLYVPEGFAHGFCVLSDVALLSYLCTELYYPEHDAVVAWNDPDIGIRWPVEPQSVSGKDQAAPWLRDIPMVKLPRMSP